MPFFPQICKYHATIFISIELFIVNKMYYYENQRKTTF